MYELTSDADKVRIIELYRQGKSSPTIAALTGVPVHRVRLVLKEAGLLAAGGTRSSEDAMWPQIESLLGEGRSMKDISRDTGIPYQTVLRWCRNRGVDTGGTEKTKRLQQRALELAKTRMSAAEIADQLGVSPTTVTRWLRSQGESSCGQKGAAPVKRNRHLARALKLHEQGGNVYEIASEIGDVHYGTVINWLRREGQKPHYGRVGVERQARKAMDIKDDPRRAEAVQRYLTGEAATTIDKALKVAQGTTELWARHDGVWEQGGKFKRRRDRGELVRRLHAQGETMVAITKALGTDFYTAKKIMVEEGLLPEDEATGRICPCGADTGSPNRQYCTPQHRKLYGAKREPDPTNYVTFTCQNEKCGKTVTRLRNYGSGYSKYCCNDCAHSHTKTKRHVVVDNDVVLDNSWEPLFWGLCGFLKIPVERTDRQNKVYWRDGTNGGYAPDFIIPLLEDLAVEVKGQEDPDDAQRWAAWRSQRGALVVLLKDDLQRARLCSTRSELLNLLTELAEKQS